MAEAAIMTVTMWQRPDMRVALARHDVGAVFRLMQRYGYSQRRIGALTGITQGEVCKIAAGRRIVTDYGVLDRLVDGLGLPRGWVGLAFDDETAALRATAATLDEGLPRWSPEWNPGRPSARFSKETRNARRRTRRLLKS